MPSVRLALVSQVDEISTAELRRVGAALGTQISRDFAPRWDIDASVEVLPAVTDVPLDCWPVLIQRDINVHGAAGIHLDKDGQPFALIEHSDSWTLALSHQCLSMLADPFGNRTTPGPSPKSDQGTVNFLVEVCDPCENAEFAYAIDGVMVSDFVTPSYYGREEPVAGPDAGGSFDFTGAISKPLEVLRGGYLSWHEPKSNHWWQLIYFGEQPEFRDLGELQAPEPEEEEETERIEDEDVQVAPEAETSLPSQAQVAGQLPGATNDQAAAVDQLGFRDYVTAFVRLITSPDTRPPITIGIFGSWGVGKSFLLRHIRESLERASDLEAPQHGGAPQVHVVELNAWSYSASKAVWPSLVRAVMECGEREIAWAFPGRFLTKFWENLRWEIRRERGKLLGGLFAGLLLLSLVLWSLDFNVALLTAGAAALGATGIVKVGVDTLTNPLTRGMAAVLKSGEYGEDIGYMSRIQHDLEQLSKRLGRNHRIVVLIDDLDRCEPDKMVEVLQAINLLLNFRSFIVCLGIDARVVTRAIERHYQGLLEEAHASGYEYLDKIVQIPFRIPRPTDQEVQSFLGTQLRQRDEDGIAPELEADIPSAGSRLARRPADSLASAGPAVPTEAQAPEAAVSAAESADPVAFTETEIRAFEELAPFLEPNPRHLKRIVNVYRLVRSLATVRLERFVLEDPAGTIRLLAFAAQWPYTLAAMFDRLDDMVEAEAAGATWPSADPLDHLYTMVKPGLDRDRQTQLDRELDDLDRLLAETRGKLSWKALASLRRYIVNFNPAVEEELRVALAIEAAKKSANASTLKTPSSRPKPRRRTTKPTTKPTNRKKTRTKPSN